MAWDILDGLDDTDRRAVLQVAVRRRFANGETLFHQGDPGASVHLIDRGHVAIKALDPLGTVITLDVLSPGMSFGELSLLGPEALRSASAVAIGAVETRMLGRDAFADLRRRHPSVGNVLVELLAARVRRLSEQLMDAYTLSADARVLKELRRLATSFRPTSPSSGSSSDGPVVSVPITQEDLASLAGTTRSTANRALQPYVESGVLTLRRGRVEVHDLCALGT